MTIRVQIASISLSLRMPRGCATDGQGAFLGLALVSSSLQPSGAS
jgi:hypothetical protein